MVTAKKSNPSRKAAPVKVVARKASVPAAADGPVTLDQAKALAAPPVKAEGVRVRARSAADQSTPSTRGAARSAVDGIATATPGAVGAERKKLELKQRRERQERIREYKATLAIMKKRGVAGLEADEMPRAKGRGVPKTGARQPLQIFAEGDSWFDYPVPLFRGGIVPRLERLLGVPILNLAKAGDEVRHMMGVAERKLLAQQLSAGCPAGGPWDVLLFSGGGNDIVDNPMALWIRDFDPAIPVAEHIHRARFDAALALVRAGYEDLIDLRNQLSPDTRLVLHAYDFAIPDGRGICHLGPWMKPTFDLRKFPSGGAAAAEVVKAMLKKFAAVLKALEARHPGVTFINAQGTLAAQRSAWHNELHPSKDGFDQFARIFHARLKALFPGRVLA